MSSFLEVDENLEETQFVDAVNGYDSSVNDDSAIGGEVLDEDEPFENDAEPEQEQEQEEEEEEEEQEQKEQEVETDAKVEIETTETDNVTFTITDGSMNYNREYYTTDSSRNSIPKYKDVSMNNAPMNTHTPIPRRPNQKVFKKPLQRPGQHLKTMLF
jgi:hypothetical protein